MNPKITNPNKFCNVTKIHIAISNNYYNKKKLIEYILLIIIIVIIIIITKC